MFKLIKNIKEISKNINPYTPIYPDAGTKIENIEFPKKYKMLTERAGRKIITNIKNSARLASAES
jgi:hypothetical protein